MKRCPTCQATYSDAAASCPRDGAALVPVSVTMGWDAVEAPAEAAPMPAPTAAPRPAPAPKPVSVTAGWDVPEVPDAEAAPAAAPPEIPKERPQAPMKSSPVARKTLFGIGVVKELDATGEGAGDGAPAPAPAPVRAPPLSANERPTMAYPAAAPASAIYEAVTYEDAADEPAANEPVATAAPSAPAAPAAPAVASAPTPVDLVALALAETQTAIPGDIAHDVTAPSASTTPTATPVPPRRESTAGAPASGNRTFLIVLVAVLLIGAGIAAALLIR